MRGNPHADSVLLFVQRGARNFLGTFQDKRVRPRSQRFNQPVLGIRHHHQLTQLGEIVAHQREMVLIIELADFPDAFQASPVGQSTA